MTAAFFYLFATLCVGAGALVVVARNPVHAVLFLILAFFNAAGLFVLLGAEFLAMLLVVVYVGAVAVLFLFVVMMLDVDFAELRAGFVKNAWVGFIVGGVVLLELLWMLFLPAAETGVWAARGAPTPDGVSNTAALGRVLYTKYVYLFQGAGMVLLVAMIGAIVLTLRHKPGVKRQVIMNQVLRTPKTGMTMSNPRPGEGIGPGEGIDA